MKTKLAMEMNVDLIAAHVIEKLRNGLSKDLTYHSVEHTLDVLKQAVNIAVAEKITDEKEMFLLKVAALYHDTGFLFIYKGHEEAGCRLAMEELPGYGLTEKEIETVCGMLMASKIPQSPKNKLEEIICDADLDYLGRGDYQVISNNLLKEFLKEGIVKNDLEWMQLQARFFESHKYFTDWSNENRNPLKLRHLENIKSSLQGNH